jgi:hypothetical protein
MISTKALRLETALVLIAFSPFTIEKMKAFITYT